MVTEQQMSMMQGYNTENYGVIQERLNTHALFLDVERFLDGKKLTYKTDGKSSYYEETDEGVALCNDRGKQGIMSKFRYVINSQVVQGNFLSKEDYDAYIYEFNTKFADDLMENLYIWGINETNYSVIINNIMDIVIPFMSRLIENKERDSYANSMTVNENSNQAINTNEKKTGGFKIPFLNGG